MGRKRWAERRRGRMPFDIDVLPAASTNDVFDPFATPAPAYRAGTILCGHPLGDGAMCMMPASTEHAATHVAERQLDEGTAKAPAGSGGTVQMKPSLYRELTGREYPRRPGTYAALKAASAERAQFTAEQAQELLSAALGTRPHLAARVVDQLGPVLGGELARAVDASVQQRYGNYLRAERETLDRLYADQLAKLQADQERRSRDVNAERWTTPSRLS